MRVFVGKTHRRVSNFEDRQDKLIQTYAIVAQDESDSSIEYVFHKTYDWKPKAEEVLEKVENYEPSPEDFEDSEKWEFRKKQASSLKQRLNEEAFRERQDHRLGRSF